MSYETRTFVLVLPVDIAIGVDRAYVRGATAAKQAFHAQPQDTSHAALHAAAKRIEEAAEALGAALSHGNLLGTQAFHALGFDRVPHDAPRVMQ